VVSVGCHESARTLIAFSLEEPGEWVEYAVDLGWRSTKGVPGGVSSFPQRQTRIGCQVMSQLFHGCGTALATRQTLERFWRIAGDGSRRDGV